jgi:hypothetical protein
MGRRRPLATQQAVGEANGALGLIMDRTMHTVSEEMSQGTTSQLGEKPLIRRTEGAGGFSLPKNALLIKACKNQLGFTRRGFR